MGMFIEISNCPKSGLKRKVEERGLLQFDDAKEFRLFTTCHYFIKNQDDTYGDEVNIAGIHSFERILYGKGTRMVAPLTDQANMGKVCTQQQVANPDYNADTNPDVPQTILVWKTADGATIDSPVTQYDYYKYIFDNNIALGLSIPAQKTLIIQQEDQVEHGYDK